jgi:hypothetical protein
VAISRRQIFARKRWGPGGLFMVMVALSSIRVADMASFHIFRSATTFSTERMRSVPRYGI